MTSRASHQRLSTQGAFGCTRRTDAPTVTPVVFSAQPARRSGTTHACTAVLHRRAAPPFCTAVHSRSSRPGARGCSCRAAWSQSSLRPWTCARRFPVGGTARSGAGWTFGSRPPSLRPFGHGPIGLSALASLRSFLPKGCWLWDRTNETVGSLTGGASKPRSQQLRSFRSSIPFKKSELILQWCRWHKPQAQDVL